MDHISTQFFGDGQWIGNFLIKPTSKISLWLFWNGINIFKTSVEVINKIFTTDFSLNIIQKLSVCACVF